MEPLSDVLTSPGLLARSADKAAEKLVFVLGQQTGALVLAAALTEKPLEFDGIGSQKCEAVRYPVYWR